MEIDMGFTSPNRRSEFSNSNDTKELLAWSNKFTEVLSYQTGTELLKLWSGKMNNRALAMNQKLT